MNIFVISFFLATKTTSDIQVDWYKRKFFIHINMSDLKLCNVYNLETVYIE